MPESLLFRVSEVSAAGEIRRNAVALSESAGFDETDRGNLAIVAMELARNVAIHGRGGEVLLRLLHDNDIPCIELLALDKGPGMADPARCMRDGYSTAGTAGTGLGAIRRLSWRFDLHSAPGVGTAILSRLRPRQMSRENSGTEPDWGIVQVPKSGEQVCGDAWSVVRERNRTTWMVVDGLGHGPVAQEAATEAVRLFQANSAAELSRLPDLLHAGMRHTRGAAASIVRITADSDELQFVGIGNVAVTVVSPTGIRNMASNNGTLGHVLRNPQTHPYSWHAGDLLVMCSDGLVTHWQLDAYPGLVNRHPALIAGVLYRDFNRGRDDVTVLVVRNAASMQE